MKAIIITTLAMLILAGVVSKGYPEGDRPKSNRRTPVESHSTAVCQPRKLIASWYSVESLKKEGTWRRSKGMMANGERFREDMLWAATRIYPLGMQLNVRDIKTDREITVTVTDRVGKRFAQTRIDLSPRAFSALSPLSRGIIQVEVTPIERSRQ